MRVSQLVELAASPDLSSLFSQAELAELLQCERAATVLQMRNSEQAAAAAGEQRQDGAGEAQPGEDQRGGEAMGEQQEDGE